LYEIVALFVQGKVLTLRRQATVEALRAMPQQLRSRALGRWRQVKDIPDETMWFRWNQGMDLWLVPEHLLMYFLSRMAAYR